MTLPTPPHFNWLCSSSFVYNNFILIILYISLWKPPLKNYTSMFSCQANFIGILNNKLLELEAEKVGQPWPIPKKNRWDFKRMTNMTERRASSRKQQSICDREIGLEININSLDEWKVTTTNQPINIRYRIHNSYIRVIIIIIIIIIIHKFVQLKQLRDHEFQSIDT